MVEQSVALSHYADVVAQDNAALQAIENGVPIAGLAQTPETRLRVLRKIDPGNTSQSMIAYPHQSPVSRPAHFLIHRVFSELDPELDDYVMRDTLTAFLDETLLPMTGIPESTDIIPGHIAESALYHAACYAAEGYFIDALDKVNPPEYAHKEQRLIRIYHDSDGQPIAFGKQHERPFALLLRAVGAGVIIPAGTIVGVDRGISGPQQKREVDGWSMASYLVNGSFGMRPTRLSSWAHPAEADQVSLSVYNRGTQYDASNANMVTSASIADFQLAARDLLALCNIT